MKVMLLAAGKGERMRPLTSHTPKPMLMAGGKALIVRLIERLAAAELRDLVINHAYLGHKLEEALGDGVSLGVEIAWSREGEPLETAGGILKALPLLGDAPFAVANADVHCDYDFARLWGAAEILACRGGNAWLLLVPNPSHHPQGDFSVGDDGILGEAGELLTYAGIGVFHPRAFQGLVPEETRALGPLLRAWIREGKVHGEVHAGIWRDIGTPGRLAELDRELRKEAVS